MNPPHAPEVPKLFYSTWGRDFYSEHWLTAANCWIYAVIKFVEANLELQRDRAAVPAFERLAGSDLLFLYPDPSQRQLVHELFTRQYEEVARHLSFSVREQLFTFPVDPFKSLFVYVTMDRPAETPAFVVHKLSEMTGESVHHATLEPEHICFSNLHVYFQYFIVVPDKPFLFEVEGSAVSRRFRTPAYGVPLVIASQMEIKAKYNKHRIDKMLYELWGHTEAIPMVDQPVRHSRSIHTRQDLLRLLAGKKAAVFKYNKECYSFLRFRHLLPCSLQVIFDDAVEVTNAVQPPDDAGAIIPVVRDAGRIDEFDFDALILTCGFNYESELVFFRALLDRVLERDLPVLSLYDDILDFDVFGDAPIDENNFYRIRVAIEEGAQIPELANADTQPNVLAVFGTDTVQGKFTTQIHLREGLRKYMSVAHVSTEPTGTLLGSEAGFSRVDAPTPALRFNFERQLINRLAREHDLVVTGGQNSIVFEPFNANREDNTSTRIFNVFLPRIIVLTVAVDTDLELIEEARAYIAELARKNAIASRVIALAMMGGRKLKGARWTETYFVSLQPDLVAAAKRRFEDALGLPLFVIPDEADELARTVALHCQENDLARDRP